MADLKLNTTNGSITLKPENGTGNVDLTVLRGGFGKVLQVVSKVVTTRSSQIVTTSDTLVNEMFLSIVPKSNNSIFRIDIRWFGERSDAWDTNFNVTRNGTRINVPTDRIIGVGLCMPTQTYHLANDSNSTPEIANFSTLDKTAGTVAGTSIEYKLQVISSASGTLWNNRCFTDGGTNYEYGSSEIIITEIGA